MSYLLLSIAAYVFIAWVLRWGAPQRRSRMVVMAANYAAATLVTAAYVLYVRYGGEAGDSGLAFNGSTLLWGGAAGVAYAASLLLWMVVIGHAGIGASTTAMRLSVVWPVFLSLVVFGEVPSASQGLGLLLACAAIVLLALPSGVRRHPRLGVGRASLIALWVTSGGTGVLLKAFQEWGEPDQRAVFLLSIFLSAGLICWAWVAVGKVRDRLPLCRQDVRDGVLFGLGNAAGNGFFLRSLENVSGVVAFPLRDAGVIVLVSLLGMAIWKERPGRRGVLAVAVAACAVILLAL